MTTLSIPCWTGDHEPDRCTHSLADGDRCDCPCHAEPSTVLGHEGEHPTLVAAQHRLVEQAQRGCHIGAGPARRGQRAADPAGGEESGDAT